MKWLGSLILVGSLIVPFGASRADQTTAPGQQKKEAGDGSAKEYAPGQEHDSESGGKESKEGRAKAKSGKEKAKPDKTKAGSAEAVPDTTTGKSKAKGTAKAK